MHFFAFPVFKSVFNYFLKAMAREKFKHCGNNLLQYNFLVRKYVVVLLHQTIQTLFDLVYCWSVIRHSSEGENDKNLWE